jgi:G3E family GTPase
MAKRIPILLVTGFLGAGKTTFLNWLIHTHPQLKVSLILNEFGDVKLESQFIKKSSGGDVTELANGCMCCVAKSDIPRVINYILDNSPQTEYILIEASGLSDPDPIHEALQSPNLTERIRLDSILCIADAVNFEKNSREHSIVMSQVGDSDIVLISKTVEAGEETVARIKKLLTGIGTGTKVLEFSNDLEPRLFLDPDIKTKGNKYENKYENEKLDTDEEHHHHTHEPMQEYWFKSDKDIDLNKLQELMRMAPAGIIRAKGFINSQKHKYLLQYVGTKLELEESNWQPLEHKTTNLLFLGKNFDEKDWQIKLELAETNQNS